ncbi:MAG: mechanosensitive ion channel domain-containing protein [Gammaproteobacteria bacterium]
MQDYGKYSELLTQSWDNFIRILGDYIPSLLGALILLVVGLALAWVVRWLILRLGTGLDRLYQRLGFGNQLSSNWSARHVISGIAFWLIILFFVTAAAESLGLPGLADWLNKLIAFLPAVMVTLLIIVVGVLIGGYARERVRVSAAQVGLEQTALLGSIVRLIILTVAVILAFRHLGLDVHLIEQLLIIAVAAFFAAVALAFGLGAGLTVNNIISSHYVRKMYHLGQRVRINDIEGEIVELTPTAVVLDTAGGRIVVPAKNFNEHASILLDLDSVDGH